MVSTDGQDELQVLELPSLAAGTIDPGGRVWHIAGPEREGRVLFSVEGWRSALLRGNHKGPLFRVP